MLTLAPVIFAALSVANAAPCPVDDVESRISWAPAEGSLGTREDRVVLFADTGRPDCVVLPIDDLPGTRLQSVQVVVRRTDERPVRFGEERLQPVVGGWALHLPEVRRGATVMLRIRRTLVEPQTAWHPAAYGPATWAQLRVRGGGAATDAQAVGRLGWSVGTTNPTLEDQGRGTWVGTNVGGPNALLLQAPGQPAPAAQGGWTPAELRSAVGANVAGQHSVVLAVRADANWLPEEPPVGRTKVAHSLRGPGSQLPRAVVFPTSARDRHCSLDATDATLTRWGCLLPAASGAESIAEWSWTEPTLRVTGRVAPDGASGSTDVSIQHGELAAAESLADGSVGFRVGQAGGRPVLATRDDVLHQVAYNAVQASMPEPGLPMDFKNRKVTDDTPAEVLQLVQGRVRTAALPFRGSLSPRPLTSLRRSGWATPWEQALLLTRYLRQLKLDAIPAPVRPTTAGEADPGTPIGYSGAVVRLVRGDVTMWLDPSCRVCAPGELPPALWGGQALAEGISRLPAPPAATIALVVEGRQCQATLNPPAALGLRLALLDLEPDDRAAAIPAMLGFPALVLDRQDGLQTPGAPVTLHLTSDDIPAVRGGLATLTGLTVPALSGAGRPTMPTTMTMRRALEGTSGLAGSRTIERPGAAWTGRVVAADGNLFIEESLTRSTTTLPASGHLAVRMRRAIVSLTSPPPPRQSPPADGMMPEGQPPSPSSEIE